MSTSEDSTSTHAIDISARFAPIFWGYSVSLLLGGIAILQSYLYFMRSKDRYFIRLFAVGVITMDIVDSALVASSLNYYLVKNFGSTQQLNTATPELTAECLIATILTTITQVYFLVQLIGAKRLGKGSWIVIIVLGIFCALALAGGIACVVTMHTFKHGVFSNRNSTFSLSFGIAKGFSSAADIVATVSVCVFLESARAGMTQTSIAVNTLMKYVIQRGSLVTIMQTLLLVTFYASPRSVVWFSFHVIIPKLYTNTFFAMLNARETIRKIHIEESSKQSGSRSSTHKFGKNNASYDIERGDSTLTGYKKDGKVFAPGSPTVSRALLASNYHDSS